MRHGSGLLTSLKDISYQLGGQHALPPTRESEKDLSKLMNNTPTGLFSTSSISRCCQTAH